MLNQPKAGHNALQAECRAVGKGFFQHRREKRVCWPGLLGGGSEPACQPPAGLACRRGSINGSLLRPPPLGAVCLSSGRKQLGGKAIHLPSAPLSLTTASGSGMGLLQRLENPFSFHKHLLYDPFSFHKHLLYGCPVPGPQVRGSRGARPACTPQEAPRPGG